MTNISVLVQPGAQQKNRGYSKIKRKRRLIVLFVALFLMVYLLSLLILNDYYLFEWTARHYYLYIWLLGFFLIYLKKDNYAVALSISNIIGIVVGQLLGDYLREQNMLKITSQSDNETIYRLSKHYGVLIWIIIIMVSMIIFATIKNFNKEKKE